MRRMVLFLLPVAMIIMSCSSEKPNPFVEPGKASVTLAVVLNKLGGMNRGEDIELRRLEVRLYGDKTIVDTVMLTSSQQQTVVFKHDNLTTQQPWTISGVSYDAAGRAIHYGKTQVILKPGCDTTLSLQCDPAYSMLVTNIFPIQKNFRRCVLNVSGTTVVDTGFNPEINKIDTVRLRYNYVPASMTGIATRITLEVHGIHKEKQKLLYLGDTTIMVYAGRNMRHHITLYWVGDETPTNANLVLNVVFGAVGTTIIDGEISDDTARRPPMIIQQPLSQSIPQGQSATFLVSAIGAAPLTYQWFLHGVAIPGAIANSVVIKAADIVDTASLYAVVSNKYGSVCSNIAYVYVQMGKEYPQILKDLPTSLIVKEHDRLMLNVECAGMRPLKFQWFRNKQPIWSKDSTVPSNVFIIVDTRGSDSGYYNVEIGNQFGTVMSKFCRVSVIPADTQKSSSIKIVDYPVDQTATEGQTNFSFKVWVESTITPLFYQWRKNGVDIAGANQYAYIFKVVTRADEGMYSVRIWNARDTIEGRQFTLKVYIPDDTIDEPHIVKHPTPITVAVGASATFNVLATGIDLHYQWFKDGDTISSARMDTYTIAAVKKSDEGKYSVHVWNRLGVVKSAPVELVVKGIWTARKEQ
ncbi:MAG: immunoglobulin domain-containing protein [Chitinivibrionales bacterium]|nr:immunoglobulin domain-containing protein [Chitinivibrionales bacterium]